MNTYKKFIPKRLRFMILKLLGFLPDELTLRLQYRIKLKRRPQLEAPLRYTEKLQQYKLYYRNELLPICVDKYAVREYLRSKGLSDILVRLYAVYDRPEDIEWEKLPDKFIIKTTNGSGTNIICRDKAGLDIAETVKRIKGFFRQSSARAGREWAYLHVQPKIIVEQLLEDESSSDGSIRDYKFLCFGGKPEYAILDVDRFKSHKRNIYDTKWHNLHISSDCPCSDEQYAPPEKLEEMLEIAKTLSRDFPAVRVDLYCIGAKIYFGELTFYPWSGYVQFSPDSFDFTLGRLFPDFVGQSNTP